MLLKTTDTQTIEEEWELIKSRNNYGEISQAMIKEGLVVFPHPEIATYIWKHSIQNKRPWSITVLKIEYSIIPLIFDLHSSPEFIGYLHPLS